MELCELDFNNKQQVFDFVLDKVVEQGEKSACGDNVSVCRYRLKKDDKILKCGIGHLLSDQEYMPEFEGKRVIGLFTQYNFSKFSPSLFYNSLQIAHDAASNNANFVSDFKENMKSLAKFYDLTYRGV